MFVWCGACMTVLVMEFWIPKTHDMSSREGTGIHDICNAIFVLNVDTCASLWPWLIGVSCCVWGVSVPGSSTNEKEKTPEKTKKHVATHMLHGIDCQCSTLDEEVYAYSLHIRVDNTDPQLQAITDKRCSIACFRP